MNVKLTTYKKDGTSVTTKVSAISMPEPMFSDGTLGMKTFVQAGKTKRMRRDPHVTVDGRPYRADEMGTEPWTAEATRRIIQERLNRAHPILHRWFVPFMHRRQGRTPTYFVLVPERT